MAKGKKAKEEKAQAKAKEEQKKPAKEAEAPRKGPKKEEGQKMEAVVRLAETAMDGTKPVKIAIRRVKGVSFMLSNAVARVSGFGDKRVADLTDAEQKKLEDIISNPQNYGIPAWLYNRKRDPATGEDKHLSVSNLDFVTRMDINELKKIRCYRGIRHAAGLPVRGQRTRGSFRKGKIVGVVKKKARQQAGGKK